VARNEGSRVASAVRSANEDMPARGVELGRAGVRAGGMVVMVQRHLLDVINKQRHKHLCLGGTRTGVEMNYIIPASLSALCNIVSFTAANTRRI
jgi:hypothetical protein